MNTQTTFSNSVTGGVINVGLSTVKGRQVIALQVQDENGSDAWLYLSAKQAEEVTQQLSSLKKML